MQLGHVVEVHAVDRPRSASVRRSGRPRRRSCRMSSFCWTLICARWASKAVDSSESRLSTDLRHPVRGGRPTSRKYGAASSVDARHRRRREPAHRLAERQHRPAHLGELALQHVDPGRVVGALRRRTPTPRPRRRPPRAPRPPARSRRRPGRTRRTSPRTGRGSAPARRPRAQRRASCSPPPTPCRTVTTKSAPTNRLISPVSTGVLLVDVPERLEDEEQLSS